MRHPNEKAMLASGHLEIIGIAAPRLTMAPYRAYDLGTEWSGPPRDTIERAEQDAHRHNEGCEAQGGFGRAQVVVRAGDRLQDLSGQYIYPPHGKSTGAAQWRE